MGIRGLDLGQIVGQTQQILGQQQATKLRDLQIEQQEGQNQAQSLGLARNAALQGDFNLANSHYQRATGGANSTLREHDDQAKTDAGFVLLENVNTGEVREIDMFAVEKFQQRLKNASGGDRQIFDRLSKLQDRFNKDKLTRGATELIFLTNELETLEQLVAEGNKIGASLLMRKMARTVEKGVLTAEDVAAFGGDPALDKKIKRYIATVTKGDLLLGKDLRDFQNIRAAMRRVAEQTLNERADLFSSQAVFAQIGLPQAFVKTALTGSFMSGTVIKKGDRNRAPKKLSTKKKIILERRRASERNGGR